MQVKAFIGYAFIRRWNEFKTYTGTISKTTEICTHVANTDMNFIKNLLD